MQKLIEVDGWKQIMYNSMQYEMKHKSLEYTNQIPLIIQENVENLA